MVSRGTRIRCVGALLAVFLVLGCASNQPGSAAKGKPRAGQVRRSGPINTFEASHDPPIASDTRYAAGQLAESRGALPQAAEQYRQALHNNPNHVNAMYRLGVIYAGMKKYPEAIETWKKYVQATGE